MAEVQINEHSGEKRIEPNIFTIPPGTPFLSTFAKSLMNGDLLANFRYEPEKPHTLAKCRIYVPTRRAARALRSEFSDQIGHRSVILPDIRPLGEVEDDLGFFDSNSTSDLSQDEPVSNIQAMLILGELILAWKQALPKAFSEQLQFVPLVAPANPSDALWLAAELLSLLESAQSEEIDLNKIDNIDLADHAEWWQLTLEFLKIVRVYWPERLKEMRRQSNTKYLIQTLDKQTIDLGSNGHDGPVIVAGSTGSLPATARLIKTVSHLQNGVVVLPGLDQEMQLDEWSYIYNFATDPKVSDLADNLTSVVTQGHPQFGLARLLYRIGVQVTDIHQIPALGFRRPEISQRCQVVSKAMLPSALTNRWISHALTFVQEYEGAFHNVSLLEAANDREEAASIAVAMRIALETSNENEEKPDVALVTPDRNLALKVSVELQKYGIEADDSGGLPLSKSSIGKLLKLALFTALGPKDHSIIAAMLKHPFALFGFDNNQKAIAISVIERTILRGSTQEYRAEELSQALVEYNLNQHKQTHIPIWCRDISSEDIEIAINLADKINIIFSQFCSLDGNIPIQEQTQLSAAQWTTKTIDLIEAMTISSDGDFLVWDSEAGQKMVALLEDVASCPAEMHVSGREWLQMLEPLLSGQVVKPKSSHHPRVMIWGALEARLQDVDTIILAGLNENIWPGTSSNDPFLSRSMKSEIGLEPPERRIGLAAHDFQMGMGAKNVVLSRSKKSNGAPTVASRWIQRLCAVLDDDIVKDIRSRGDKIIAFSNTVSTGGSERTAARPDPKPDQAYQPNTYSFSEISTLRRDPYAVYAKRILKLQPLDGFSDQFDLRLRGTIFHAILEDFSRKNLDYKPSEFENLLNGILFDQFNNSSLPAEVSVLWKDRFNRLIQPIAVWERSRLDEVKSNIIEASAKCRLPGELDFYIAGRADRIDIRQDGSVDIIDFKTGISPSAKEARSLLDPQLPLEAFAVMNKGFHNIPTSVASLKYVRLKPAEALIVDHVEAKSSRKEPEPLTAEQLGQKAGEELSQLLHELYHNRIGFKSRTIPKMDRDYTGDYNHLARVSEWSVVEAADEDTDHG